MTRVGALVPANSAVGYLSFFSKLEKRKQWISFGLVRSRMAKMAEFSTLSVVYWNSQLISVLAAKKAAGA